MSLRRHLGLLTPEVEALAHTNFYDFVGAVDRTAQETVYAPYLIYQGKILLDNFIKAFNGLDAMIQAKAAPRELLAKFREIAGGQYKFLLTHMEGKKWRVEPDLDYARDIMKCAALRACLVLYKPEKIDDPLLERFYNTLHQYLESCGKKIAEFQATPLNLPQELARQLQEFESYKQKFKDAQQKIIALSKKPASAVPANPLPPATSATPAVVVSASPSPTPSAPPHEEKSPLPVAGSPSTSREAARDSDDDSHEGEHGGSREGQEPYYAGDYGYGHGRGGQRVDFLQQQQQQPPVAVAASGANLVGKPSQLSFVAEAKKPAAAAAADGRPERQVAASYANPPAVGRVSALSVLAPPTASQAAAAAAAEENKARLKAQQAEGQSSCSCAIM